MKTIKYIFGFLVGLAILSSCETTIDYDLPQESSKITIDAKLRTGDSAVVVVGTSIYSLSSNNPILMDTAAKVWLYENNVPVVELKPTPNPATSTNIRYFFSSSYKLKSNQTYKVEASLSGFTPAYGEGITKDAVPVTSTAFDTTTQNLVFTFQDPPTKGDYYMITVSESESAQDYYLYYRTKDVVIDFFDNSSFDDDPFGGTNEKYGIYGYLSDQYFNGKNKSINITIDEIFYRGGLMGNSSYKVQLWRISEDLYEHQRTKAIAWQSENPFSEPVQIYSNITNGYGIVGTVALSSKQFYP